MAEALRINMENDINNNGLIIYKKNDISILSKDGKAWVSSRQIANHFEKEHFTILRDIERLECSRDFTAYNFVLSSYPTEQGKKVKMYLMTRDGFAFLAMGFTGSKAAKFKEAYINTFNEYEKQHERNIIGLNLLTEKYEKLLEKAEKVHQIVIGSIVEIDGKVQKHEDVLQEYDERLLRLETVSEPRKNITQQTRKAHIAVWKHAYDKRCPMCNEKTEKVEIDHFKSRKWGGPGDTWPICGDKCHKDLTAGTISRESIRSAFANYQRIFQDHHSKQLYLPLKIGK